MRIAKRSASISRRCCLAAAVCCALILTIIFHRCANLTLAAEFNPQGNLQDNAQQADALASRLVEALGAKRFADREQAMRELSELGIAAEAALRAGLKSNDAEIRDRCQTILQDVVARDLQVRLERFKTDLDGTSGHGLPGFDDYTQLVGNEPITRDLFADMYDQAPGVMFSLASEPMALAEVIDAYIENMFTLGANIMDSPAGVTALYYASSLPDVRCKRDSAEMLCYLAQNRVVEELAAEGEAAPACQKILNQWLSHNVQLAPPGDAAQMALKFNLPAGLALAKDLSADKTAPPDDRMHGILAVAKLGDVAQLKLLQRLFEDREICQSYTRPGERRETQIRDVALAAALHLLGEDPQDFGFSIIEPSEEFLFTPHTLSFSDERDRQMAFAKFYARFGQLPGDGN